MKRLPAAVGLIVFGLGLATVRGVLGGGQDEEIPFALTASLVSHRDLAFDTVELGEIDDRTADWQDAVRRARDGRWYAVYGPGQSALAVPLYLLGQLAAGGGRADVVRATEVRWACGLNPLLTGLTAWLLCAWALALGTSRGAAAATGLGFGLATTAWPYAKTFLSEPLAAFCYLAAAYALWRWRWLGGAGGVDGVDVGGRSGGAASLGLCLMAGLALGLAVLTRPHNVVVVPLLLPLLVCRRGAGRGSVAALVALLVPVVAVCAWWLWYNQARFGRALAFGYLPAVQGNFALANLGRGLVGQLLSPGRGFIWYAPPALLAIWGWPLLRRRDPVLAWTLLAAFVGQWSFYSLRSTWWGNWCWGPRYLVPVLPLAMLAAAPALDRPERWVKPLAAGLLALGLAGAWSGLVLYNGLYQDWLYRQPHGLDKLLWSPAWSPLVGHWRLLQPRYVDLLMVQLGRHVDWLTASAATVVRLGPALLGVLLLSAGRAKGADDAG